MAFEQFTQSNFHEVESGNLTIPAPTTGDYTHKLFVAVIAYTGAAPAPQFSVPAGWTIIEHITSGNDVETSNARRSLLVACWQSDVALPADFVFTRTGGSIAFGQVLVFRGHVLADPVDVSHSTLAPSSSVNVVSSGVTTTQANDGLLVAAAGWFESFGAEAANISVATDPVAGWDGPVDYSDAEPIFTALAYFQNTKSTAGPTGNITVNVSHAARHCIAVVAFKAATSQSVTANGIASTAAFGSPSVNLDTIEINPASVPITTAFGAPSVTAGPVTVSPEGIASVAAFGEPTLQFPPQSMSVEGIASTIGFGDFTSSLGPATVSPASIDPTTAFGTPYVANTQFVAADGIASTLAFGTAVATVEPVLQAYLSELKFENAAIDLDTFRERFLFGGPVGFEDFRLLVPGDYQYQNAKVRIDATTQTSSVASISALSLKVDAPDIKDRGRQTIGAEVATVNFNRSFTYEPPEVIAVQVGGTTVGRVRVSNITLTSFDVEIRDGSDALMAGTVSWMAHGW